MIEFKNPRDEVCRADGWAFIGFVCDSEGPERQVPIGVYRTYREGAMHSNSWLKSTPNGIRWEGQQIYEPVLGED